MLKSFLSTDELNNLRNVLEQQMEITQSFIEEAIDNKSVDNAFQQTEMYFKFKNITYMLTNLNFDFDYDDYIVMVPPLEYFIEMLSDSEEDLEMLYNCAATLAKIKVYLELYPK
jgi:hypothetical protein